MEQENKEDNMREHRKKKMQREGEQWAMHVDEVSLIPNLCFYNNLAFLFFFFFAHSLPSFSFLILFVTSSLCFFSFGKRKRWQRKSKRHKKKKNTGREKLPAGGGGGGLFTGREGAEGRTKSLQTQKR
jgi:hypothetical protein